MKVARLQNLLRAAARRSVRRFTRREARGVAVPASAEVGDFLRAFDPLANVEATKYEAQRTALAKRHKDALVSSPPQITTIDEWDGDLTARRVRLHDGDLTFECFGTPSSSKRLVVLLTGGGARADRSQPLFHRVSWHPWLDAVCVNIDDPTLAAHPAPLDTGWYLGTEKQDAIDGVVRVVAKIQQHYGIANEDVSIVGSSAGGTAALKLANAIAGSTAIAENPPIYPHRRLTAASFKAAGLDLEEGVFRERNRLESILDHPSSRFFIFQNFADRGTIKHIQSFLKEAGLKLPGIGLTEFGSLNVYVTSVPARSPHYTFLSETEMRSVLAAVERNVPIELRKTILDAACESMRSRILSAQTLQGVKIWARVIAGLWIPALVDPPVPTDGVSYSLALRSNPAVVYRLQLSHDAKNIAMSVEVDPKHSRSSADDIKQVAEASGATVTDRGGRAVLTIAKTPVPKAAGGLKRFVELTAVLFE